jgi:hypothetical protein
VSHASRFLLLVVLVLVLEPFFRSEDEDEQANEDEDEQANEDDGKFISA